MDKVDFEALKPGDIVNVKGVGCDYGTIQKAMVVGSRASGCIFVAGVEGGHNANFELKVNPGRKDCWFVSPGSVVELVRPARFEVGDRVRLQSGVSGTIVGLNTRVIAVRQDESRWLVNIDGFSAGHSGGDVGAALGIDPDDKSHFFFDETELDAVVDLDEAEDATAPAPERPRLAIGTIVRGPFDGEGVVVRDDGDPEEESPYRVVYDGGLDWRVCSRGDLRVVSTSANDLVGRFVKTEDGYGRVVGTMLRVDLGNGLDTLTYSAEEVDICDDSYTAR